MNTLTKRSLVLIITLIALLMSGHNALAADADHLLDKSFGTGFGTDGNGTIEVPYTGYNRQGMLVQADNKIVIFGSQMNDIWVSRLNADGTVDSDFGTNGSKTIDLGGLGTQYAFDAVIQPDGKIILVGQADSDFAVVRLTVTGELDSTFGSGLGYVLTDFDNETDVAYAVALQPDGKIVVGGVREECGLFGCDEDFALARYNTNGTLDNTFDGNGLLVTGSGSDDDYLTDLAIFQDGGNLKILAVGFRFEHGNDGTFMVRYHENGALDSSFGGDGTIITDWFGDWIGPKDAHVRSDNKVILSGIDDDSNKTKIVRMNLDGSLDTTFGTNGFTIPEDDLGLSSSARIALQADNSIVVFSAVADFHHTVLAHYTADGDLNLEFGNGFGYVTQDYGHVNNFDKLALGADGTIYTVTGVAGDLLMLARFYPDGSLDDGGRVVTNHSVWSETVNDIVQTDDGRIVTIGYHHFATKDRITVGRYFSNGDPDTSFGGDGFASAPVSGGSHTRGITGFVDQFDAVTVVAEKTYIDGSGSDLVLWKVDMFGTQQFLQVVDLGGDETPSTMTIQPDGQILVAGTIVVNGLGDYYFVARFNPDGTLDDTFVGGGNFGYAINYFGESSGAHSQLKGMALDSDGNILVVGSHNNNGNYDFAVNRHLYHGGLDNTFDGNGKLVSDLGLSDVATAVTTLPDGDILVGGTGGFGATGMQLLRFNSDGSADTLEGDYGLAQFAGFSAEANDMVVLPNGDIVLVGCRFNGLDQRWAIAYFSADGTLNTDFSVDGRVIFGLSSRHECANGLLRDNLSGNLLLGGYATAGLDVNGDHDTAFALMRVEVDDSVPTAVTLSSELAIPSTVAFWTALWMVITLALASGIALLAQWHKRS